MASSWVRICAHKQRLCQKGKPSSEVITQIGIILLNPGFASHFELVLTIWNGLQWDGGKPRHHIGKYLEGLLLIKSTCQIKEPLMCLLMSTTYTKLFWLINPDTILDRWDELIAWNIASDANLTNSKSKSTVGFIQIMSEVFTLQHDKCIDPISSN